MAEEGVVRKGRGHAEDQSARESRYSGKDGFFSRVPGDTGRGEGPQQSIEGWIVFVRGIHEEAAEEDVRDKFADYGQIKQIHLNIDRRTGFAKGYALIEYEKFEEAQAAINACAGGVPFMDQIITAEWAFQKGPRPNARPPPSAVQKRSSSPADEGSKRIREEQPEATATSS
ncbi:putative RNA-binding protein Y14 [Paratrimastix pyriformis]|uniref:RNA-binding protein Y14 n=1 Tax=Paratrimastix pyriformis TaxID=342808 RepID=A0ABQ8UN98_9EUKA|nr:putative RNA-binding protein Y14 [Paratrimastix pyriformis]|eukprot:GAFH01004709.1.p2 GENE.GAFH01004709.1~~GAFH01004709.1.p2  ORF type:complete len:183 (-),score=15.26 GAFH01004709.1:199-714(-)